MGCKPSKGIDYSDAIVDHFETTYITQVDKFFAKSSLLFQKSEAVRKKLYESIKACYRNAGTSYLPSNKYLQTMRVFLWSLSAAARGQILRSGIKIVNGPPYISCSTNGLCDETLELYKSLRDYFAVIVEGNSGVKEVYVALNQMRDSLLKGRHRINEKELAKSNEMFASNMVKFNKGLKQVKDLAKTLKTARSIVERSIPTVKSMAEKADRVGIKAYSANVIKPAQIFEEFGSKQRKVKGDVSFDISGDELEDFQELAEGVEKSTGVRKSRSPNKKGVEDESEDEDEEGDEFNSEYQSPQKSRRNGSQMNSTLRNSNSKKKRLDDSENSPDMLSRESLSEFKVSFGGDYMSQKGNEVSSPMRYSKIKVNAPEMKDLAAKKKAAEAEEHLQKYKFFVPDKEEKPPKVLHDPFEVTVGTTSTMKPVNLINNLILADKPQNKEPAVMKQSPVKNETVDIVALTKQYLAENQKVSMMFVGDENIEEEETSKNVPIEKSETLANFCEKRHHYLVNLKS